MRIILVGDIHVHHLFVWPWHLIGKRFLGQTNMWFHRRRVFKLQLLAGLFQRIMELEADLQLFSGDFTTTALSMEFKMMLDLGGPAMEARPTFVIPGNHDRYTFTSSREKRFERYFGKYTTTSWPAHRRIAPGLDLIALDATRPTFFNARGRLGKQQLDAVKGLLNGEIEPVNRLIVLCHYSLGPPPGFKREPRSHALSDADELVRILHEAGRETLYLHGHVHAPWCWRLSRATNIVAINAGAPVMVDKQHLFGQGFWEIEIPSGSWDQRAPRSICRRLVRHVADKDGNWRMIDVKWPENPGDISHITPQPKTASESLLLQDLHSSESEDSSIA